MFRVQTLGGLTLFDGAGARTETIRRRLALLAILAIARQRGVTRDKLVAYLWPDSRDENARHSLEQLLYGLRTQIDRKLFVGTDPLRLNPDLIATDIDDFETAFESGDLVAAVRHYHGPFLDGFFLTGSRDFEEWVARERSRLQREYAIALERLATRHRVEGNAVAAVECWQNLVALDPLDARTTLGLLEALEAAEDYSAARQQSQVYAALVERELGRAADPAVLAFLNALPEHGTTAEKNVVRRVLNSKSTARAEARSRKTRFAIGGAAALLIVASLTALRIRQREVPAREQQLDAELILVLPFRVTGADSSLTYLREGMIDLLATSFAGEAGPRAIDPRAAVQAWRSAQAAGAITEAAMFGKAAEVGAGQLLLGEVVGAPGSRVVLNGKLFSTADQRVIAGASVVGHVDSILVLADGLATQLLALRAGEDRQRLSSLMTTSPSAVAAFLAGRAERRRGHEELARGLLVRALEYDSTFALAALELVLSVGRVLRWSTYTTDSIASTRLVALGHSGVTDGGVDAHRALEIAWRERGRLSAADQTLLAALHSDYPRVSSGREIVANWQRAATIDRVEAHYWLGRLLLYHGPALGMPNAQAHAAASFNRAFALDSSYVAALAELIEIAAFQRDTAQLRRLARLFLARDSAGSQADYVRWRVATVVGDEHTLSAVRARFTTLDVSTLSRIQWVTQMDAVALEDAERASVELVRRATLPRDRQVALYYARMLALNRGRPNDALRLSLQKREYEPNDILFNSFAIRDALFWDGNRAAGEAAARAFAHDIASLPSAKAGQQRVVQSAMSVALWYLWQDDPARATEAFARLQRVGSSQQIQALEALLTAQLRQPNARAALAALDTLALQGCCIGPHFVNLIAARLHERAGNRTAALSAIRRGRWHFAPEHLSTYLREEARLAALTGDHAGAIRAYRHYLTLRASPERALQFDVDRVRRELALLEQRRR